MKLLSLAVGLLPLSSLVSAAGPVPVPVVDPEVAAARKIDAYQKKYQDNILKTLRGRKPNAKCTEKNLIRRKEWGSVSKEERIAYVAATHCLARLPNEISNTEVPGARNRYDDFVSVHLQQTPWVHFGGNFLNFHRHYVHLYEKALRDECGYRGAQPYWDWSLSYRDVRNHSIFEGTPWSLGGNGFYEPDREDVVVEVSHDSFLAHKPATGGGCIQSGPFTADKWTVNLGPIGYNVSFEPPAVAGGYGYNPRCARRDLNPLQSQDSHPTNVTALLEVPDYASFNIKMDAEKGSVHGAGHFQVGGIQLDTYASPGDPIFWAHHAALDRIWTIWQNWNAAEVQSRTWSIWGTGTSGNWPLSADVTFDSLINFGVLDTPQPIGNLVSTIDGPFCYMYV